MFKFNDPWWLQTIWLSILIFIVGLMIEAYAQKRLKNAFGKKAAIFLTQSLSLNKKRFHLFFQCLALACFAVALARPLMGVRQTEVKQTGVELIIALDVSNSMLAEDDKPSRLEHAKHEIANFVDHLNGDRIGLIAFAGSAVLASPMTSDHSAIKLYLASLSTNSVSTQGTDFKDVIAEAIRAFEKGGVEGVNGTSPTRVLLIASDGEDNEHGATNQIKKAVDMGIRIFTLGFGSAKGAPIPMRDERGNLKSYKKDKGDQVVMSIPSDEVLTKLARAGSGSYYHSSFDESEVKLLINDIDKLQKADFKTKMSTDFDEKFQIPLFLGILLALCDLLFGTRKDDRKAWRGRFGVQA